MIAPTVVTTDQISPNTHIDKNVWEIRAGDNRFNTRESKNSRWEVVIDPDTLEPILVATENEAGLILTSAEELYNGEIPVYSNDDTLPCDAQYIEDPQLREEIQFAFLNCEIELDDDNSGRITLEMRPGVNLNVGIMFVEALQLTHPENVPNGEQLQTFIHQNRQLHIQVDPATGAYIVQPGQRIQFAIQGGMVTNNTEIPGINTRPTISITIKDFLRILLNSSETFDQEAMNDSFEYSVDPLKAIWKQIGGSVIAGGIGGFIGSILWLLAKRKVAKDEAEKEAAQKEREKKNAKKWIRDYNKRLRQDNYPESYIRRRKFKKGEAADTTRRRDKNGQALKRKPGDKK